MKRKRGFVMPTKSEQKIVSADALPREEYQDMMNGLKSARRRLVYILGSLTRITPPSRDVLDAQKHISIAAQQIEISEEIAVATRREKSDKEV